MYRLFSLAILVIALGCAEEPASPPTAGETPDDRAATADAPIDVPVPHDDPPFQYPEKTAVQRLLVRASELESKGKFEEALAIANQAVAVDPSSPSANELKVRLEELLRRIQPSPLGDEQSASSRIAQRTSR